MVVILLLAPVFGACVAIAAAVSAAGAAAFGMLAYA